MDPLSVSASINTLIQVTSGVVALCFGYATAGNAERTILELCHELQSFQNVLQSVGLLARSFEHADSASASQILEFCDTDKGRIAKRLKSLDEKLRPPKWASRDGSKRKAVVCSLTWPLKESETKKTLQDIERLKSDLEVALSTHQL